MFRGIRDRISAIGAPLSSLLLGDLLRVLAEMIGYITLPWWIVHKGGARDLVIYSASIALTTIVAMPLLSPLGDRVGAAMCEGLALAASGWAHPPVFLVLAFICVYNPQRDIQELFCSIFKASLKLEQDITV